MNDNYRDLNRRLDLAGTLERVAKREQQAHEANDAADEVNHAAQAYQAALVRARKAEKQSPQQVSSVSEAARRGLNSYDPARHARIDVERLKRDPLLAFFILANRSVDSV